MIPKEHQAFIDNTVAILKQDSRIVGIALGGSYISGDMDQYSDLDFVIAVNPQDTAQIMSERIEIAKKLGNLLSAFTGEHVGEPRLLVCLYDCPLMHVDLKFVSLDDAEKRIEDPVILYQKDNALSDAFAGMPAVFPYPDLQWMEDRFWVWVHYVAGKIARGEIFEAIESISFIRQNVVAQLMQIKNGRLPRGVRHIEQSAPEDMPALIETIAVHDEQSCISALRTLTRLYLELREPYCGQKIEPRFYAQQKALGYLESVAKKLPQT